jgi:hypothetical protein
VCTKSQAHVLLIDLQALTIGIDPTFKESYHMQKELENISESKNTKKPLPLIESTNKEDNEYNNKLSRRRRTRIGGRRDE